MTLSAGLLAVYYALADTMAQTYWYLPGDEAPGAGPLDFAVDRKLLEATLDAAL